MTKYAIETSDITKKFGDLVAVDHVNFIFYTPSLSRLLRES